jgi:hypothetical protein
VKEFDSGLDQRLQSPAQLAVRDAVQALPEDSLSMSWRSGLNERLIAVAEQRRRKQRFWLFFRPTAGLVAACGLVAVLFIQQAPTQAPASKAPRSEIGTALVSFHQDAVRSVDIAGTSINPIEAVNNETASTEGTSDWSEVDVESL